MKIYIIGYHIVTVLKPKLIIKTLSGKYCLYIYCNFFFFTTIIAHYCSKVWDFFKIAFKRSLFDLNKNKIN